jgi:hypothetical protein
MKMKYQQRTPAFFGVQENNAKNFKSIKLKSLEMQEDCLSNVPRQSTGEQATEEQKDSELDSPTSH